MQQMEENERNSKQWWSMKEVVFTKQMQDKPIWPSRPSRSAHRRSHPPHTMRLGGSWTQLIESQWRSAGWEQMVLKQGPGLLALGLQWLVILAQELYSVVVLTQTRIPVPLTPQLRGHPCGVNGLHVFTCFTRTGTNRWCNPRWPMRTEGGEETSQSQHRKWRVEWICNFWIRGEDDAGYHSFSQLPIKIWFRSPGKEKNESLNELRYYKINNFTFLSIVFAVWLRQAEHWH